MRVLMLAVLMLMISTVTFAQEVLKVPLGTAQFGWDVQMGDPGTGDDPTQHVITCGTHTLVVPMPANTAPVKDVVPGPGTYECTLYAENDFDRSPGPDPSFPSFTTGFGPKTPAVLRIEVK